MIALSLIHLKIQSNSVQAKRVPAKTHWPVQSLQRLQTISRWERNPEKQLLYQIRHDSFTTTELGLKDAQCYFFFSQGNRKFKIPRPGVLPKVLGLDWCFISQKTKASFKFDCCYFCPQTNVLFFNWMNPLVMEWIVMALLRTVRAKSLLSAVG